MLHCVCLAFTKETKVAIGNIKWFSAAMMYGGRNLEQWFFPMSLNAPAIIVNVPWQWRTAMKLAKQFMLEETANKFVLMGADFLPTFKEHGIVYSDIPEWMLKLAKPQIEPW